MTKQLITKLRDSYQTKATHTSVFAIVRPLLTQKNQTTGPLIVLQYTADVSETVCVCGGVLEDFI